ncbi:MAG TPA: FIST N-terminal domain-containing protein [Acidimicrobiales bacterium]|nr:FIST N-terminal domain-containing protein [Acidimicrobiales bacterium]
MTAAAVGETAGQILEALGRRPALATVFVTPHHAGALEDAAAAVRAILEPDVLVGCSAVSIVGNGREVEDGPGVVLWAATLDAPVAPVHLTVGRTADGLALGGWPDDLPFEPAALLLLADPFSFPAEPFFDHLADRYPGLPIVGGNASAASGPGGNRLVVDDTVTTSGAVGALVGPGIDIDLVVSQGCRPVGQPFAVTRAEENVVFELGGEPAFSRLTDIADKMAEEEASVLRNGVLLGVVVDERKLDYERGDFLARNLIQIDRGSGAVAVGDVVPVGTTAQYLVRDARTADDDLRELLVGRRAQGALVFTCNGRGARFFTKPDHDALVVAELLDEPATAGFFAAGEFGPIGRRNFVHGYTAAIALMADSPG